MRGLAFAALSSCLVLAGASFSSAASPRADLRITGRTPLTVKGDYFKARERVTVTTISDGVHVQRARASRAGTFTARFPDVSLVDRCTSGASIRAIGSLGSRALAKIPRRACMPERSP